MTNYDKTVLPTWLKNELPDMHPFFTLYEKDGQFFAHDENGQLFDFNEGQGAPKYTFDDFDTVYSAISNLTNRQPNFTIDDSILKHAHARHGDKVLLVGERDDNGSRRLYLFYTEKESLSYLEHEYKDFLEHEKQYCSNPKDFYTCYEYVTCHPAFWSKATEDKSWDWETTHTFEMFPLRHDNQVYWYIEGGAHEPDSKYTRHYLDTDIITYATTIEEAFIQFAHNVYRYFDSEGNDKRD